MYKYTILQSHHSVYGDRQWKCNYDLHNFSIIESDHVLIAVYLLK